MYVFVLWMVSVFVIISVVVVLPLLFIIRTLGEFLLFWILLCTSLCRGEGAVCVVASLPVLFCGLLWFRPFGRDLGWGLCNRTLLSNRVYPCLIKRLFKLCRK